MSDIPIPDESPTNEWVKAVAETVNEDEKTIRAIVSVASSAFIPDDDQKESALEGAITDMYFKTSMTPFDNTPDGHIWVQFPYEGEIGAHYEYRCANPPRPPPAEVKTSSIYNWTYTAHTITTVNSHLRELMEEADSIPLDNPQSLVNTEFTDDRITIIRVTDDPDFQMVKHILSDGFNLDLTDIVDVYGQFWSEWSDEHVYWND